MRLYDEDHLKKLKFQHSLLLKMIDKNSFPFYSLALEKDLSESEVEQVLMLCRELQKEYEEQCELGFVHHTPLLVHFVGMLPDKLPIAETLQALKAQNLYVDLIDVLQRAEKRVAEN